MSNIQDEIEKKPRTVRQSIERLRKELRRYTSLKAAFARGIIYGVGTAIGATVIAAIVLWLLFQLFGPIVGEIPFLENIDFEERLSQ